MVKIRAPKVIKVGCDFSGLCTLGIAMHRMLPKNKFRVEFSSDTKTAAHDLAVHATIKPKSFYQDVQDRDLETTPNTDLYVWTPPCQTWSGNSKSQGLEDHRGRLMAVGVKYIVAKKPRAAIMENVKGLYSNRFKHVRNGISKTLAKTGYHVFWKVLRASDFEVPQDRDRLFMVAIHKTSMKRRFRWPRPRAPKVFLTDILDDFDPATDKAGRLPSWTRGKTLMKNACKAAVAAGIDPLQVPVAIDVDCSIKFLSKGFNIAKTLTEARGRSGGPWISSRGRRVTTTEMIKIQGFKEDEIPWERAGLAKGVLGDMLGNAVPVPMLGCILQETLWSAGLVANNFAYPSFWDTHSRVPTMGFLGEAEPAIC